MHCCTRGTELGGLCGGRDLNQRGARFMQLGSLATPPQGVRFEVMRLMSSPQLDAKIFFRGNNVFNTARFKNIAQFDR